MRVRFYLDENVQLAIADQLKRRGIEVVTVHELGLLGDEDINHLERATDLGYVLCTHDADYVDMAAAGKTHAGMYLVNNIVTQLAIGLLFLNWCMAFMRLKRCTTSLNM